MRPQNKHLIPGNPKATGRPTDAWKALCRECADKGTQALLAQKVLEDPDHPAFLGAWKFLAEQGHGKAAQSVDVTSGGEPIGKVYLIKEGEEDWTEKV